MPELLWIVFYVIEVLELWRRAVGVLVWSSGGVKARGGRADVKAWRFGALEARRRCIHVRV